MIKYTRKQINKNALLHNKEFVTVDDAVELMDVIFKVAIENGADAEKLMEHFNDE